MFPKNSKNRGKKVHTPVNELQLTVFEKQIAA